MNGQILWLFMLIIMTLAQVILLIVRSAQRKRNNPGNYGERIATLEAKINNVEKDIEEIKKKLNNIKR